MQKKILGDTYHYYGNFSFFVIFKRKYTLLLHTSTFQRKYIRNKWITLKLSSLFSESVSILLRFLCLFFVSFLYLHIYRIISLLFFNFCSVVFSTTMSYSQSFTVQTSNTVSFMAHNDLFFLDSSENTGKYIVLFPIKSNNFISFFFFIVSHDLLLKLIRNRISNGENSIPFDVYRCASSQSPFIHIRTIDHDSFK